MAFQKVNMTGKEFLESFKRGTAIDSKDTFVDGISAIVLSQLATLVVECGLIYNNSIADLPATINNWIVEEKIYYPQNIIDNICNSDILKEIILTMAGIKAGDFLFLSEMSVVGIVPGVIAMLPLSVSDRWIANQNNDRQQIVHALAVLDSYRASTTANDEITTIIHNSATAKRNGVRIQEASKILNKELKEITKKELKEIVKEKYTGETKVNVIYFENIEGGGVAVYTWNNSFTKRVFLMNIPDVVINEIND